MNRARKTIRSHVLGEKIKKMTFTYSLRTQPSQHGMKPRLLTYGMLCIRNASYVEFENLLQFFLRLLYAYLNCWASVVRTTLACEQKVTWGMPSTRSPPFCTTSLDSLAQPLGFYILCYTSGHSDYRSLNLSLHYWSQCTILKVCLDAAVTKAPTTF